MAPYKDYLPKDAYKLLEQSFNKLLWQEVDKQVKGELPGKFIMLDYLKIQLDRTDCKHKAFEIQKVIKRSTRYDKE